MEELVELINYEGLNHVIDLYNYMHCKNEVKEEAPELHRLLVQAHNIHEKIRKELDNL